MKSGHAFLPQSINLHPTFKQILHKLNFAVPGIENIPQY